MGGEGERKKERALIGETKRRDTCWVEREEGTEEEKNASVLL